jgi:hypothetical protein
MVEFFGCKVYLQLKKFLKKFLNSLATKLLKKFFPAQRTRQLRRKFRPSNKKMETYSLRHGSTSISYFSNAHIITYLKTTRYKLFRKVDSNQSLINSASGGVLMEKSSEEAIEFFETLRENSQQFSSQWRQGLKGNGI